MPTPTLTPTPTVTVTARLAHDTGASATDGLTQDLTVSGTLQAPGGLLAFTATLDATPAVSLAGTVQPDGSFVLSPAALAVVAGGAVPPGAHTLHLQVSGPGGVAAADLPFTFALPAPVALALLPADQSGQAGGAETGSSQVTMTGRSIPGATLTL